MRLEDTVIVVTGGSSGIGLAMAKAFVAEGANVVCSSRTKETLEEAVASISDGPGRAIAAPANVRRWEDVQNLIETTLEEFGTIDVLVNNAAITQRVLTGGEHYDIVDIPVDVWDQVVETNLRGSFLCTKATLPTLLAKGAGKVIFVSSRGGERAKAKRGAYAPSKFGVEALHEGLAQELEGTGVGTVVVRPPQGGTNTGLYDHLDDEERAGLYPPSVMAETAVRLAACEGENGGRYVPTPDGTDFVKTPRQIDLPADHPDFAT